MAVDALRESLQRQRSAANVRKHRRPDRVVVTREVELRDLRALEESLVWVGDLDGATSDPKRLGHPSRTTLRAGLSSRRPRKRGGRKRPWLGPSGNPTCAT